jgi:hypothetical protein
MRPARMMIVCLTAIGALCSFLPQDDYTACKQELISCVKKLSRIKAPTGKQVYYVNMTLKTEMNENTNIPDSETRADVYMSAHQLHYISSVLETYQDESDAFAVLPQRKMIVWSPGGKRADADNYMQMITQAQDTLLTMSSVSGCQKVEENGRSLKMITLVPHPQARDAYKIRRLEYFLDSANGSIARTNTYYLTNQNIVMRSITYNKLDFNYSGEKLSRPVHEQIFASENKLHGKYQGYQLVDKRLN